MTMPALPPDAVWLADGVRHQIMLRVLPVQRHDMLGPLSVVRMALAVLRRRLTVAAAPAAAEPDWAGLQGKVNEVEGQVAEAVGAVAALRWWDGLHRTPPVTVAEGVAQCAALVQLAMSLRSQQLAVQPPPAVGDGDGAEPVLLNVPAMHHALLGLLVHATEAQPSVLAWRLSWDDAALLLQPMAVSRSPAAQAPSAQLADGPSEPVSDSTLRPISASALEMLLAVTGWTLQRQPDVWRLAWPAATRAV